MTYLSVYGIVAQYQSFVNVSKYRDTNTKLSFGYHFDAHRWTKLYNSKTDNYVGVVIININYHNVGNVIGGYFTFSGVLFIEKEYDIGTLEFGYNLRTPIATTITPPGIDLKTTFLGGSLAYYNIPIKSILFNSNNTRIYYNFDILPVSIPIILNLQSIQIINIYYDDSEDFRDITSIDDKVSKLPFGYHYKDIKWCNIKNISNDIIGKIILINNFHNIDSLQEGGYCSNTYILHIEKEFPIGTITFRYNFYNQLNNTNLIDRIENLTNIIGTTGFYYKKNIKLSIIQNSITTNIEISIL